MESVDLGELPELTERLADEADLDVIPMSVYMPVDEPRGLNNPDWYVPDGHLNDAGGEMYASALKQCLTELLIGG